MRLWGLRLIPEECNVWTKNIKIKNKWDIICRDTFDIDMHSRI